MNIFDYLAIFAFFSLLYSRRFQVWRLLGSIVQSYWYKFFIKPPVLALPSVTLACYKIESVNTIIPLGIIKIIDDNILFVVAGLFLVPVIAGLEDIIKAKSSKYSDDLSTEGLFLLLTALDSPVDKKMDRFLTTLNSSNNKKDPADIFNIITEPKKQLAEITRSIHVFL